MSIPLTSKAAVALPLARVNYDLLMQRDELDARGTFPPQRFETRDARLQLFADLYRGDLTSLADPTVDDVRLAINYFGRLAAVQSEILMMSVPEAPLEISAIAGQALVDMSRYGTAVLWAGQSGGLPFVATIEPRDLYPLTDGWLLAGSYTSAAAPDARTDRLEAWIIDFDGTTTVREFKWDGSRSGGTLGEEVGTVEQGADFSTIVQAARAPYMAPGWGTSQYPDLVAPVLEIAKRFSSTSATLDYHSDPLLSVYMASSAVNTRFNPDAPVGQSADEKRSRIADNLQQFRRSRIAAVPNADIKMEYVTWDASLGAAFKQVEEARLAIQYVTGLVQLLERSQGGLSGVALRRLMLPVYAATRAMQNELRKGLEEAVSYALGEQVTVEWEHIFDQLDGVDAPTIARTEGDGP